MPLSEQQSGASRSYDKSMVVHLVAYSFPKPFHIHPSSVSEFALAIPRCGAPRFSDNG